MLYDTEKLGGEGLHPEMGQCEDGEWGGGGVDRRAAEGVGPYE